MLKPVALRCWEKVCCQREELHQREVAGLVRGNLEACVDRGAVIGVGQQEVD